MLVKGASGVTGFFEAYIKPQLHFPAAIYERKAFDIIAKVLFHNWYCLITSFIFKKNDETY